MKYERVTYREDGATQSKTVHLQDTREGDWFGVPVLTGRECKKDGEFTGRVHSIQTTLIRKRTPMQMNLKYAELEEANHD